MRTILIAGLLLAVVTAGCGGASTPLPRLRVTPAVSVEDQPVSIRFDGLERLQGVWLELRSTDAKGIVFVSRAAFGADEDGVLDLARARPLTGSAYSGGAWPMGLVTSMTAPNASPLTDYAWGSTPRRFVLTAISASRPIASTTFVRRWRQGTYTTVRATVARDGFVGTFYAPAGARHQAAVLAIGGEEGGVGSSWLGERLAAHGIPTLVVGYFHAPGLPDRLKDIPLEYFRTALGLARSSAGGRRAARLPARRLVRQRGGAPARELTIRTSSTGSQRSCRARWSRAERSARAAAASGRMRASARRGPSPASRSRTRPFRTSRNRPTTRGSDPRRADPVPGLPRVRRPRSGLELVPIGPRDRRAAQRARWRADAALCLSRSGPLRRHAVTGVPARIAGRGLLRPCGRARPRGSLAAPARVSARSLRKTQAARVRSLTMYATISANGKNTRLKRK